MFTKMYTMSVISVRIDRKVKEVLERAGVDISKAVKEYLNELAWRAELKERLGKLDEALSQMPPAERGFSARSVREDREAH